jgi:hypothetical protein
MRCRTKGANSRSPPATSGVAGVCHTSIWRPRPTAKCRPEGEKDSAVASAPREKWYRTIRRGTFVSIARPSSSTERSRLPRGFSARREMLFRWAKGSVYDLELLAWLIYYSLTMPKNKTHLTRSNMETRLPTGERRHVPSGVKSRFPLL